MGDRKKATRIFFFRSRIRWKTAAFLCHQKYIRRRRRNILEVKVTFLANLEPILTSFFTHYKLFFWFFDIKLGHFIANKIVFIFYKHSSSTMRFGKYVKTKLGMIDSRCQFHQHAYAKVLHSQMLWHSTSNFYFTNITMPNFTSTLN